MNKDRITGMIKKYAILILCFFVFIINTIFVVFMKAPVFTDENGVVANAAFLSGLYDWSSSYTSSVSMYWGYGYSVLWIPLFYLISDMFLIYRLIGVINAFIVALIPGIIYSFINHNFPVTSKKTNLYVTLILGLHPITFVFTKHAWNEPMLLLLQWLILYSFFACYRNKGKKRVINSIIMGFLCAYACSVHERGIIFCAAIIFSAFFLFAFTRKRTISLLFYISSFFLGYEIHKIIKLYLVDNLLITESARNTTESLISKDLLNAILNIHNINQLLGGMFSQAYYIATSSFGLLFISIFSFFIIIYKYEKTKKKDENLIPLLLLSIYTNAIFFGTLIVSTLFYYKSYITNTARGLEYYFYGRYNESTIGIVLLLAILFILSVNSQIRKKLLYISFFGIFLMSKIIFAFLKLNILKISSQIFNEINLYFFMPFGTSDFADHAELIDFVMIGLSLLVLSLILCFLFIKHRFRLALSLILCIYFFVDAYYIDTYLIPRNNAQYNAIQVIVDYSKKNHELFEDIENIYLTDVSNRTLTMQLVFPDHNVHFLNTKTYGYKQLQEIEGHSLIISNSNEMFEEWIKGFKYIGKEENFYLWEYDKILEDRLADREMSLLNAYQRELPIYSIIVNNYQSGSALYNTDGSVATQTCIFLNDGSICFPNRVFLPHQYELEFIGNMLDGLVIEVWSDKRLGKYEIVSKEYGNEYVKMVIAVEEEIKNGEIIIKNQEENPYSTFVQLNIIPKW